jgi:hypothetical protein
LTVSELIKAVVPVKLKVEREETFSTANVLPSCVERKLVETKPPGRTAVVALDKYPAVPNPITVEPSCVAKYEVETKLARFAVETKLARLAVLINEPKATVERYPTVPRPITVLVRFA